jgi:hypothetical protein
MTDDEERVEDEAFHDTLARLELMAVAEGFELGQVTSELKTIENYEGLDWTGRGGLKAAEIAGTILAYQAFIMRYKKRNQDR